MTAKIKPLFKKQIKTEGNFYKPTSLLSLILKLIEKSVHDKAKDYLQRNELLLANSPIGR